MTFKSTNELAIWTNDETFEGSYLLQFEIFLANFPASPHRQEIVEVVVTNFTTYTVQQPQAQNSEFVSFNQSASEPLPSNSTSKYTETFIVNEFLLSLLANQQTNSTEGLEEIFDLLQELGPLAAILKSILPPISQQIKGFTT
jgi:hypothetical protein